MPTAIAEYRFAYSARVHETRMEPPSKRSALVRLTEGPFGRFFYASARIVPAAVGLLPLNGFRCLSTPSRSWFPAKLLPHPTFFVLLPDVPGVEWKRRIRDFLPSYRKYLSRLIRLSTSRSLSRRLEQFPDPGVGPDLAHPTLMPQISGAATAISANMKSLAFVYAVGLVADLLGSCVAPP